MYEIKDNMNTIHVEQPYFDFIKYGIKTIEGRICKNQYSKMACGDVIKIACGDDLPYNENKFVTAYIKDVRRYVSFWHYLMCEGLERTLPNIYNVYDGCNLYYKYYSHEQEMLYGVVAIELHVLV